MYITDKNGRRYRLPTVEEEVRIRAGIAADPDTHELTDAEMVELRPLSEMRRSVGRPQAGATKERITIRLDLEILASFRATGPGWQTRMNEALKDWLKTHSPA
jgi:uncharacterized protein (DUF4415 family)